MSMVPYLWDDMVRDMRRPMFSDVYDRFDDDIRSWYPRNSLLRSWRTGQAPSTSLQVKNDKEEFRVNLDVQQFKPEELKVKVADGYLVVEAKHEERSDEHGFISRQFTRRYKLPQDVEPTSVVSALSSDGVLSLHAPKKGAQESNVREIPITSTNMPMRQVSQTVEKPLSPAVEQEIITELPK